MPVGNDLADVRHVNDYNPAGEEAGKADRREWLYVPRTLVAEIRHVAVLSLGALSALHVLWATGSAWPAGDRKTLADAVGGFAEFPAAGA